MRIGVDARLPYYQMGGISQYVWRLVEALAEIDQADDFTIFHNWRDSRTLVKQPNFRRRPLFTPCHHQWEGWSLPLELAPYPLDVLHSPDFIAPYRRRCSSVITIHDLAFLRFPEIMTKDSLRYYSQIKEAAQRAQGIIAVSQTTRRDLAELVGIPEDRVDVIYNGVDSTFRVLPQIAAIGDFVKEKELPDSFMLWVGVIEPRKSLETLIFAMDVLRKRLPENLRKLVIVGALGWLYEPILSLVEKLDLGEDVTFFGPASREELPILYNSAWVFVFPSLYEGFGLPPLEAMACGTPVVSSSAPALPEILGAAPLYFEPFDVQGLADAVVKLAEDPELRKSVREKGLDRAAEFSWAATARETLAVYRRARGV